jgi:hypothetical protein
MLPPTTSLFAEADSSVQGTPLLNGGGGGFSDVLQQIGNVKLRKVGINRYFLFIFNKLKINITIFNHLKDINFSFLARLAELRHPLLGLDRAS